MSLLAWQQRMAQSTSYADKTIRCKDNCRAARLAGFMIARRRWRTAYSSGKDSCCDSRTNKMELVEISIGDRTGSNSLSAHTFRWQLAMKRRHQDSIRTAFRRDVKKFHGGTGDGMSTMTLTRATASGSD